MFPVALPLLGPVGFGRKALGLRTPQATTSGTAFDFTGISPKARRISVLLEGVSLDGTDHILVQIGDSGGLETTGYVSTSVSVSGAGSANVNSTSGFIIRDGDAARIVSGRLVLENISGDGLTWVASGSFKYATDSVVISGGDKTLTAALDRIRVTRSGTDNFDAGSVNIAVET